MPITASSSNPYSIMEGSTIRYPTNASKIKIAGLMVAAALAFAVPGTTSNASAVADTTGVDTKPTQTSTIAARAADAQDQSVQNLTATQKQQLDRRVSQRLQRSAGGERISVNQIAWEDGDVILTLPVPGVEMEPKSGRCESKHVCLYSKTFWEGEELNFYTCAFRKLRHYGWTNRTSSWTNHNAPTTTGSARAALLVWTGSRVEGMDLLEPGDAMNYVGDPGDNTADFVRVCKAPTG